jgi:hypothetical protein
MKDCNTGNMNYESPVPSKVFCVKSYIFIDELKIDQKLLETMKDTRIQVSRSNPRTVSAINNSSKFLRTSI